MCAIIIELIMSPSLDFRLLEGRAVWACIPLDTQYLRLCLTHSWRSKYVLNK